MINAHGAYIMCTENRLLYIRRCRNYIVMIVQFIIAMGFIYASTAKTDETVDLYYQNLFTPSDKFEMLDKISLDAVTLDLVIERMNTGLPFVAFHVTHNWKVTE